MCFRWINGIIVGISQAPNDVFGDPSNEALTTAKEWLALSLIKDLIARWERAASNPYSHVPPSESEKEFMDKGFHLTLLAAEAQEAGNTALADEYWREIRRLEKAYEGSRADAWREWFEEMKGGDK